MSPLEAAEKYRKGYDDQWMCLVPRPEAITENSTFLSDHESRNVCACEFEAAFLAGAAYERERAKGLTKAIDYCLEHTDDSCWCGYYGDDSEETGPSTCHLCNARNELIKWRQHDSK